MSIPKKIHYCWFGNNPLPQKTINYMESWKKFCPDYEVVKWDESNFDINSCKFVKEAYKEKKWAFVSDYVRFYAMYTEGGIYIETDSELLKPIDELLKYDSFFGLAGDDVTLAMCGTTKGNDIAKAVIDKYNNKSFYQKDGSLNTTSINKEVFDILVDLFDLDTENVNHIQLLGNNNAIFPEKYFFSYDYMTGLFNIHPELYVKHYGDGTWLDSETKKMLEYQHKYVKIFGKRIGVYVGKSIYYLKFKGIFYFVKKIFTILVHNDN